jgi:CheY-like chemotaxis protein
MNGWEFCRQFRDDPSLAGTPFLFLSSVSESEDRALGLELGADDYVIKPVNLRELELRVTRALRRGAPETVAPLGGDLSRLPLPDLLQLLAAQRQTGILRLSTPDGEAEITLRGGRILSAVHGSLRGRPAVLALIFREAGRFRFDPIQVYMQDEVVMGVQELILEAARQRDESVEGQRDTGTA